jgi:HlyD family secretion protein
MDSSEQEKAMSNPVGVNGVVSAREPDPPPRPPPPSPNRDQGLPQSAPHVARGPAIVVALIVAATVGLSLWYLAQPQPLIVQGEADATRIDIAARVDGRVGKRPVERGENAAAGQLLFEIDNAELVTKLKEAEAGLAVATAQLANIEVGTRAEIIARRKAAVESASANLTLAQQTYDRVKELAAPGFAPIQKLDEATNSLRVAQHTLDEVKLAVQEAVNGATKAERGIARANVVQAQASVDTIRAQVHELTVKAPIASQVYQIGAELGNTSRPAFRCSRSST